MVARNAMSAVFDVMLAVFDVTRVSNAAILFAFVVMLAVFDAMFAVLVVTVAGKVDIVEELTPPILFTVGKSAVPPKSFVNLSLPFTLEVASGVAAPPTNDETNSVVANCVVLVPAAAVGKCLDSVWRAPSRDCRIPNRITDQNCPSRAGFAIGHILLRYEFRSYC